MDYMKIDFLPVLTGKFSTLLAQSLKTVKSGKWSNQNGA